MALNKFDKLIDIENFDNNFNNKFQNIEAEMAALKERALARTELYRDITGRPDNTQAIARALTAFGATAAQGTGDDKADIAAALAAGSNQLFDEAAKRTDIKMKSIHDYEKLLSSKLI